MSDVHASSILQQSYKVSGMTCASCAISIETYLRADARIQEVLVNYPNQSVTIRYNPEQISLEAIAGLVKDLGYELVLPQAGKSTHDTFRAMESDRLRLLQRKLVVAVLFSTPVFVLSMFFMDALPYQNWILLTLSIPVLVYSGSEFFVIAWKRAMHRTANMDTLVALSTLTAFVFSLFNTIFPHHFGSIGSHGHVYYESAVVIIALILLGRYLEERAKGRASSAIHHLMGLRPTEVTVIRNGEQVVVPMEDVKAFDLVILKPGDKIPVDGKVKKGESYVDESMITGEPVPVIKQKGDPVFTGTINQKGGLQILAEKVGEQTLLSRVIAHIEAAQSSKPKVQQLVDRIAGIFVPVVIVLALITFLIWWWLGPEPSVSHAIMALVNVLIIACPCALGLATPTALMVGIGKGASKGILVKNAQALEQLHTTQIVVMDKTGTITEGHPTVQEAWFNNEEARSVVLSMEQLSEHPIAEAIVRYLDESGVETGSVENFQSITGRGASATWKGRTWHIGSERFLREQGCHFTGADEAKLRELTSGARTIVLAGSSEPEAIIAVADTIRPEAKKAIRQLQDMQIEVHMLTGDQPSAAEAVAREVGITEFRAQVLPEDKLAYITNLQEKGYVVAMAGDGINDSAALARADVGIAMGGGTDIAMESADITLMHSNLSAMVEAISLSRATIRTIRENLFWAFIYNLIAIPVAAGVLYPAFGFTLSPMLAGAAMSMSSISVVANSLRLKRKK